MYCQLGDIVFDGLKGIDVWDSDSGEAFYAEHPLVGGKPRLQKTGDALEELSLNFRFHAKFCNPQHELSRLNKAKADGEVLPLLMGDGRYIADYVIVSAPYTVDHALADGTIVQATVTVTLKEFVHHSRQEQQQQAARKSAFATGDKKPVLRRTPQPPTDAADAAKSATQAAQQAGKIDSFVSDYENNVSGRNVIEQAITDACDKGNAALTALNDKLNTAASLKGAYAGLVAAAQSVGDRFSSIKALFPISNIQDLKDANTYLQAATRGMRGGATPLFSNVITRRG